MKKNNNIKILWIKQIFCHKIFYYIGKIARFLLYNKVRLPWAVRAQSEDMYFAVAPETSPAKCLSYFQLLLIVKKVI